MIAVGGQRSHRWLVRLGAAALLLALSWPLIPVGRAATLTGGTYTYIISGEEVAFTFDPIRLQDQLLLPSELFGHFGIQLAESGRQIRLDRASVVVELEPGQPVALVGGRVEPLGAGAVRLNGRLFLPAELLRFFGIAFAQDGTFLLMREYAPSPVAPVKLPAEEYTKLRAGRSITTSLRADNQVQLQAEFTLLSPGLIQAANLELSAEVRARLLDLAKSRSLLLVQLSNRSIKAGSLVVSDLFLLDDQRNQYAPIEVVDLGPGRIDERLVPTVDRLGLILYPKLSGDATRAFLYYDPNAGNLGTFTSLP